MNKTPHVAVIGWDIHIPAFTPSMRRLFALTHLGEVPDSCLVLVNAARWTTADQIRRRLRDVRQVVIIGRKAAQFMEVDELPLQPVRQYWRGADYEKVVVVVPYELSDFAVVSRVRVIVEAILRS
jgi:hypothetical protein